MGKSAICPYVNVDYDECNMVTSIYTNDECNMVTSIYTKDLTRQIARKTQECLF